MKKADRGNTLKNFRKKIDRIDERLLVALSERFKVTGRIMEYKEKNHIPLTDKERERELFNRYGNLADKLGIDKGLVLNIFRRIIKAAKTIHKNAENENL